MKYISDLKVTDNFSESIDGFSGLRHNSRSDGKTLVYSENMSDSLFPSLYQRNKRACVSHFGNLSSILPDETLARIENGLFYNGQTEYSDVYYSDIYKHNILRLGDYYVVFPLGSYYNVHDTSDFGAMRKTYSFGSEGTQIMTVDENLNEIVNYTVSESEPKTAVDGNFWVKPKNDGGYETKKYDGFTWHDFKSYVKIVHESMGQSFKVGEVLECNGAEGILGKYVKVMAKDSTGIYFSGAAPYTRKIGNYSLKRWVPRLQQTAVCGGRIIGVYHGEDEDGKFISRIYASAVNDPFSWTEYGGGLSVDVGGGEEFTAICDFRGSPVVFREHSIIQLKITEDKMTFSTIFCDGVKVEAENSPVYINGVIYYKSPVAVCAYDGSFPKIISEPLGNEISGYSGPSPAGDNNGKYCIRLADENGKAGIYVYNPVSKTWNMEDAPEVKKFIKKDGNLIALCKESDTVNSLILWDYENAGEDCKNYFSQEGHPIVEKEVRWSFETGEILKESKKGFWPCRFFLKLKLKSGGAVSVGCIYNGRSEPDRVVSISDKTDGYFDIPMILTKCNSLRLRVFGRGKAEICGYYIEYRAEKR